MNRAARRRMGYTPEKMTETQSVEIQDLIVKIYGVIEQQQHDDSTVIEALSFCLLGSVKTTHNLSQRDAVDFVSECFRRFGQFVMS